MMRRHSLAVVLLVPLVLSAEDMPAGFGEMNVLTDSFDSIGFTEAGTYSATFFLNGNRVISTPLVITAD